MAIRRTEVNQIEAVAKPVIVQSGRRKQLIMAGIVTSIIGLLLVLALFWLLHKAGAVRDHLTNARSLVQEVAGELVAGNPEAARAALPRLQEETSAARVATTDPVWRAASYVPGIGANFSAVTEVAVSADDLVSEAIVPLAPEVDALDWASLAPAEGEIDVSSLADAAPQLRHAANAVRLSHQRLSAIDTNPLLPEVAEPVREATAALERASLALTDASAAARILPSMLGSDSPREYLLLIQNSAEIRATGGIPGALAIIRVDKGRMELRAQTSASALGEFTPAILPDPEQADIFSDRMGRFMQSTNLTPHFPTAARTAALMWEQRNENASVDGVISLDPVALSYILTASGAVDLSFEDSTLAELIEQAGLPLSLTSDNVVKTLLSDVYFAIDEPKLQDAYFAAVASEIFTALSAGPADATALVNSLQQSVDEERLLIWSASPHEQEVISSMGLDGGVVGSGSGGASFGAYFNDGTGAKMDYYVRRTVQLHRTCLASGYLQYTLKTTIVNDAPSDAATSLPAYVTGGGVFGVPAGTVQTNLFVYGPKGSQLQSAQINSEDAPLGSYRHVDRPVGLLTTRLMPGESATVEVDFTNIAQQSAPTVNVTPSIQPTSEVILPLIGDSGCDVPGTD